MNQITKQNKTTVRDVIHIYTIQISHFIHPQAEMGEKEQKLETLQSKVSELKKCSQSQETPAKLQVLKMIMIKY